MWTVAPDIALTSLTGRVRNAASDARPTPPPSGPLSSHYSTADGRTLALSMTNETLLAPCLPAPSPSTSSSTATRIPMSGGPTPRTYLKRDSAPGSGTSLPSAEIAERLLAEDCVLGYVNSSPSDM